VRKSRFEEERKYIYLIVEYHQCSDAAYNDCLFHDAHDEDVKGDMLHGKVDSIS
jgi:hypothetical protein